MQKQKQQQEKKNQTVKLFPKIIFQQSLLKKQIIENSKGLKEKNTKSYSKTFSEINISTNSSQKTNNWKF